MKNNDYPTFNDDEKKHLLSLSKEQKMTILVNSLGAGLPLFLGLSAVFLSVPPEEGGIPPEVIDDLGDNRHAITHQIRKRNDNPVVEYIKEYGSIEDEDKFFEKYKDRLNLKEDEIEDEEFDDSENNG